MNLKKKRKQGEENKRKQGEKNKTEQDVRKARKIADFTMAGQKYP